MSDKQVMRHAQEYYDASMLLAEYSDQLGDAVKAHDLDAFREVLQDIQNSYDALGTIIRQLEEDGKIE